MHLNLHPIPSQACSPYDPRLDVISMGCAEARIAGGPRVVAWGATVAWGGGGCDGRRMGGNWPCNRSPSVALRCAVVRVYLGLRWGYGWGVQNAVWL